MKNGQLRIAVIKGDGIGVDVTNATLTVIAAAERYGLEAHANAARMIETAIQTGLEANRLRPVEFGGDQGTVEVTREVIALLEESRA